MILDWRKRLEGSDIWIQVYYLLGVGIQRNLLTNGRSRLTNGWLSNRNRYTLKLQSQGLFLHMECLTYRLLWQECPYDMDLISLGHHIKDKHFVPGLEIVLTLKVRNTLRSDMSVSLHICASTQAHYFIFFSLFPYTPAWVYNYLIDIQDSRIWIWVCYLATLGLWWCRES